MGSPLLHVARPSETSWNNPLLHLVFLPQGMGLFLSPLFSTREAWGCFFPSLHARRAYVELISFAFPYPRIPGLTPARSAAGCPWCCLASRAALLPTATPAQLSPPALVHNSNSSLFAGKIVERAKWACARQFELGLPAKAPLTGRKLSRVGKNRVICSRSVCPVSRERDGQNWGVDIVSGFKTDEGQLMLIPMKVNMENSSLRDVVDSWVC